MALLHVAIYGAVLGLASGAGVLPLDSFNAAAGADVRFTTTLNSTQNSVTSILWQRDGRNITSFGSSNFTASEYEGRITLFLSTGSLELRNLTIGDTGEYMVTMTTTDGEESGTMTMTVWELISDAVVTSSTQVSAEGTSLNLTCDASGSISSREWMKNDSPLNSSENIIFYNQKQVLSFRSLSRGDSGRYSCDVNNPLNSQEATFYLNVIYGPENIKISGPNEVQVQTAFKLSCSAESVPASSFVWIKNGTTLAQSFEFSKTVSELSDSGEYICQAMNDLTMKTSNASHTLVIKEVPKKGLSAGAIAGITIACLLVVAGAAVGGFFLYKYFMGQRENRNGVHRPTAANTARTSKTPKTAEKTHSPRGAQVSNDYTDEPVYENTAPIYDKNL